MKTNLKDVTVGSSGKFHLLLKEFAIRQTKANKPYLFAVFTDGTDDLTGQDWDWENNPSIMPGIKLDTGLVYEVAGSISEYNGKKQIKLVRIDSSPLSPLDFAPSGGVDLEEYIGKFNMLLSKVTNKHLALLVSRVINDNWDIFSTVPAANGIHHAYVHGLLKHSVDVTMKAWAIAEHTVGVDIDLVIAGALLHDIGKVRTYQLNGAIIEMSEEGQLIEHIMLGAMMVDKYRTEENSTVVDMVLHIISSHHGKLEYGSPTTPRTLEAVIVNAADGIDATSASLNEVFKKTDESATWTEKVWTMNNRPILTPNAVQRRLGNIE